MVTVRLAALEDAPHIANVLIETWKTTFAGLFSELFLENLSEDHQQKRYRNFLEKANCSCLIAENDADGIIGFACGGPNRSTSVATTAELYALYVRKKFQGSGIGRTLFNAAADHIFKLLGGELSVWVIEINPYRGFYT